MSGETDSGVENTTLLLKNLIDVQLQITRIQTFLSELNQKRETIEKSITLIESDSKKCYNSCVYILLSVQLKDTLRDIYFETRNLQNTIVVANKLLVARTLLLFLTK